MRQADERWPRGLPPPLWGRDVGGRTLEQRIAASPDPHLRPLATRGREAVGGSVEPRGPEATRTRTVRELAPIQLNVCVSEGDHGLCPRIHVLNLGRDSVSSGSPKIACDAGDARSGMTLERVRSHR